MSLGGRDVTAEGRFSKAYSSEFSINLNIGDLIMSRIVNIRYRCCGYNFDAAVDCDWELHCYDLGCFPNKSDNITPIELYNIDEPDWDICMVYQEMRNDQSVRPSAINHTGVDWDNLLKETRKWVREMRKK